MSTFTIARRIFSLLVVAMPCVAAPARAVEVRFVRVADGVYAHIGDLGARTADNEGLNANVGIVVTPEGVVVVDPGATFQSARDIHRAIQRVTDRPVRWVVNTGGQDHRWLGNGYFKAQGAEIIAHEAARADMLARGNDQLQALRATLGAKADGTEPTLATRWIGGADSAWTVGGVRLEFRHRGGAHTPGDMMVWLPQQQVLFSGDVVYVDRMLGVIPVSHTRHWLDSFAALESLAPRTVVPGHGRVCDVATAQAQTRDYLVALRAHAKKAVDDGVDVSAAARSFDGAAFRHLQNAADLMPGNASRTYLEVERE
jgi:glyoxylase-like metal-dependent hydrolase (beta-lactamase superfamily II)